MAKGPLKWAGTTSQSCINGEGTTLPAAGRWWTRSVQVPLLLLLLHSHVPLAAPSQDRTCRCSWWTRLKPGQLGCAGSCAGPAAAQGSLLRLIRNVVHDLRRVIFPLPDFQSGSVSDNDIGRCWNWERKDKFLLFVALIYRHRSQLETALWFSLSLVQPKTPPDPTVTILPRKGL